MCCGDSDPLVAELSHGVLPELHKVVLFVRVTNATRVTITGLT